MPGWIKNGMLGCVVAMMATASAVAATVPEPEGYRMESYRSDVPQTLSGATVLDTKKAIALWKDKAAVFIDVLPHDPKPANLPVGTIWKEKLRQNIPGSAWLANTGYGVLNSQTETYFRDALRELLGEDKDRKVAFYCQERCWMSWNAAKRAVSWGYRSVYWYPPGSDGWIAAGQPTENATPYKLQITRP